MVVCAQTIVSGSVNYIRKALEGRESRGKPISQPNKEAFLEEVEDQQLPSDADQARLVNTSRLIVCRRINACTLQQYICWSPSPHCGCIWSKEVIKINKFIMVGP